MLRDSLDTESPRWSLNPMLPGKVAICLLLPMLMLFAVVTGADERGDQKPPEIPADPYERGTPLRSVEGFLATVDRGDFETAVEYLDLRNIRGEAQQLSGRQLARRLDAVAQRANWVDIDVLSDDPAGYSGDGLPEYRDSIGVVRLGDRDIRLLVQKVPRDDGVFIWKISNATVSLIPMLYEAFGYHPFVEKLILSLPEVSFLGVALFKWVVALAIATVVYLTVYFLALAVRRASGSQGEKTRRHIFRFIAVPLGIWAALMSINIAVLSLGIGLTAEKITRYSPVSTLLTIWVLCAAISLIRELYSDFLVRKDRPAARVLLGPMSSAANLVVIIGGVLFYMDRIGLNITTVLAGLGVGGIAVALALQKPLEDILGAVNLYMQQPLRVGDFCRMGDVTGTVEEIGLRTTRVRTLANTVIAVPNAKLAHDVIDNLSKREKILFRTGLRLRQDASPEQVEVLLSRLRELLTNDERVNEGHRVRFIEIAEDALRIEIFAYLDTTDWAEYLELAEALNLHILQTVADAGLSLSLPTRALRIDSEPS